MSASGSKGRMHLCCCAFLNPLFIFSRLFESLCSSDSDGNPFLCELRPPDEDDDDCRSGLSSVASVAGSRTSSLLSLVKAGITELDEEDLAQVEVCICNQMVTSEIRE